MSKIRVISMLSSCRLIVEGNDTCVIYANSSFFYHLISVDMYRFWRFAQTEYSV